MSIEQLEEEVTAATLRFKDAEAELRTARERLQSAVNDASGIIGHVLEFERTRGYRPVRVRTHRIVVNRVGKNWLGHSCAFGTRVLKDGSIGLQRDDVEIAKARDLGPYVAPAEQEKPR